MTSRTPSSNARPRQAALVALTSLLAVAAAGAQGPRPPKATRERSAFVLPMWAFPHSAPARPGARPRVDGITPRHVPHSTATYTAAQLQDRFAVADWHPEMHPPMPPIVAHGRRPAVQACGYCHLADGIGRPENAMLAGLPEAYILEQVADMRSGARRNAWAPYGPGVSMRRIADSATDAEVAEAARYFARLRARPRSRVVETARIPRAIESDGLWFRDPRGGTEPLGDRLIDMAQSREAHELHDPLAAYVSYVPPGSVGRGRRLATEGRGSATKSCVSCHGPELRGAGLVPPLAGRAPSYLLRQLIAFRTGTRSTPASAPMHDEAASLDIDDMIAVAAYAATLKP